MNTIPFGDFAEADVKRFQAACGKHGVNWTDFYILGLGVDASGHAYPSIRIRVEYLPTGKTNQYLSGESMSWLVAFEIDLGNSRFN